MGSRFRERYLNRVWSATVDGYVDEVGTYLGKAKESFAASLKMLSGLAGASES